MQKITEEKEITSVLCNFEEGQPFMVYPRSSPEKKYRAETEDQHISFVFAKGSRRHGRRLPNHMLAHEFTIAYESPEDIERRWHQRLLRALRCMDRTGLWKDSGIYTVFQNLLTVSHTDKLAIDRLFWELSVRAYGPESPMQSYIERYPFMFPKAADGMYTLDTQYTWEASECKLKSMYFGKHYNEDYKQMIKAALQKKSKLSLTTRTTYDVSFEYNPDRNKAWYSEEYKGCGNGHYYMALDENTALFVEND